jgi:hypothetical protein
MSRGEEVGRYKRYVPEPGSDSDSGLGEWDEREGDEDIPDATVLDNEDGC